MLTKIMSCMNCGLTDEIGVDGLNAQDGSVTKFKYAGHNPFSGHMHYQCPSCDMVMLVDPISVLGDGVISPTTCQPAQKMSQRRQKVPLFKQLFRAAR